MLNIFVKIDMVIDHLKFSRKDKLFLLLLPYLIFWQIGIYQIFLDKESEAIFKNEAPIKNLILTEINDGVSSFYLNSSRTISEAINELLQIKHEFKLQSAVSSSYFFSDKIAETDFDPSVTLPYYIEASKNLTVPRSPPFLI